jgi:hypothetical protein
VINSAVISKIEKAKRYAQEPERITFDCFEVTFRGDNDTHRVCLDENGLSCTCHFYATSKSCSHTMALERILGCMLAPESEVGEGAGEKA